MNYQIGQYCNPRRGTFSSHSPGESSGDSQARSVRAQELVSAHSSQATQLALPALSTRWFSAACLFFFVALLATSTSAQQPQFLADNIPLDIEEIYTPLEPQADFSDTTKSLIYNLVRNHYADIVFDDNFSNTMLDSFLDGLDPLRLHFTAADAAEFEQYRNTLDESLQEGNLAPGYHIYNRYQQRVIERLIYNLKWVEESDTEFDFTQDEYIVADRSEAPWPADEAAQRELWRKHLKSAFLSLKLARDEVAAADDADSAAVNTDTDPSESINDVQAIAAETAVSEPATDEEAVAAETGSETNETANVPETIREQLSQRYRAQLSQVLKTNNLDVFQRYMDAMTMSFDPHTQYYAPRAAENFNMNMRLSLEGIGAVLTTRDEYTEVVSIVPGGPADLAGELQPRDRIIAVAQEDEEFVDVVGWRVDDVVQLIRGEKDSQVRLRVLSRDGMENTVVNITRDTVKLEEQSAQKEIVEVERNGENYRIGVIRLPTFYIDFEALQRRDPNYKSSSRDVRRLLFELQDEGIDGVVMDLRGNGGGSLSEANALAGHFIRTGATVQVRDADGNNIVQGDRNEEVVYAGPLAVLVDHLSASASEIFAGAMQDYQRGVILGSQTFGKGTVQELIPIGDGQMKITRAKFYRVSGESTQHRGVLPDVDFPNILDATEDLGESALDNALPWDTIEANYYQPYLDLQPILPDLVSRHEQRMREDPEFIFIREQIARIRQNRERKKLPLNEETLRAQQAENDAWRLQAVNNRREALGEELFVDIAAMESSLGEEDTTDFEQANEVGLEETEEDEKNLSDDPYLQESGRIIVDMIEIMEDRRISLAI